MNTPRVILLNRHRTVGSKLDAIRHAAVEEIRDGRQVTVPKFRVADVAALPRLLWRELVWPCRRTWAGLAATWLVLVIFNYAHSERALVASAKSTASPTEMRFALQEQQQLLLELVGPTPLAPPAEPPRRPNLQPRSERHLTLMCA